MLHDFALWGYSILGLSYLFLVFWFASEWIHFGHASRYFRALTIFFSGQLVMISISTYARVLRHLNHGQYTEFMGTFVWGLRTWIVVIGTSLLVYETSIRILERKRDQKEENMPRKEKAL